MYIMQCIKSIITRYRSASHRQMNSIRIKISMHSTNVPYIKCNNILHRYNAFSYRSYVFYVTQLTEMNFAIGTYAFYNQYIKS